MYRFLYVDITINSTIDKAMSYEASTSSAYTELIYILRRSKQLVKCCKECIYYQCVPLGSWKISNEDLESHLLSA